MAYRRKEDDNTTTYKLQGGYDKTTIAFTVHDGGTIAGKSVLIRHHNDLKDPLKFPPHFNLYIDSHHPPETQIYCNVWVTPEFAARVWATLIKTRPLQPTSPDALAWVRIQD